ncbi:hypothetical protein D516_1372 [Rhodobacter sp. AKP1]|nr:hypothetical protein D516_1372 [Rhodobacter sp. AKP1]
MRSGEAQATRARPGRPAGGAGRRVRSPSAGLAQAAPC